MIVYCFSCECIYYSFSSISCSHKVTNVISHGGLSIVGPKFCCSCRCVYYSSRCNRNRVKSRSPQKGSPLHSFVEVSCFMCIKGQCKNSRVYTWNFVLKFLQHISICSLARVTMLYATMFSRILRQISTFIGFFTSFI